MSKKQKAYEYIKIRIIEGIYAPGQRIVINQLLNELSTSAIPIREAVMQLEAEGLIKYQQNIGPVVTPIDESAYADTLSTLAIMEGYATALSKDAITGDVIEELSHLNRQMEAALETMDFSKYGELNHTFHELTYSVCPNRYLVEEIKKTWLRLDSIRISGSTLNIERARQSIAEHAHIISLIGGEGDFQEIEMTVREHKLNTIKAFHEKKHSTRGTTFI
ncbi:GntR family transcriptional regulator [Salinicoccus bachuensis]|uniref:GntR family transcriptional regulator n=1 Tax=Salinicoccus bachuensis TaxID=3136731 RepID=A0ABZ3CHZ1_9STAP